VIAASDVDNPLTGAEGATRMFGRQKGGTPEVLDQLERCLERYREVLRRAFDRDVGAAPGAGAAGGLGVALQSFLGARFRPGIEVVMEAVRFDAQVARADVLLTGEGRLDRQSLHGKAIAGVLRHRAGRPVWAVCGAVTLDEAQWRAFGLSRAAAISPERPPESARQAAALLARAALEALKSHPM
jgi:glycerate kinase